jgi:ATP-dependent Zn proteases
MADNDDEYTSGTLEQLLEDKAEFPDPRLAICEACLKRTIPAALRNRLRADGFSIVLLEVPNAEWVAWVGAAAKLMLPKYPLLIGSTSKGKRTSGVEMDRLVSLVAKKGGAIVILEGDDITDDIAGMADYRLELKLPDRSVLREVARRTLVGDAARIAVAPADTLNLGRLATCFPPGASVSTAINKLARLVPARSKNTSPVPSLETVQGLDAARDWALDLRADLKAYKAGEIPFSSIDAGAVLEGPPGTGKTMVARIIAGACGLTFVPTSIATLFATSDGDLDGVIKRFRSVFQEAANAAPSLLFIDELDALPSRDKIDNRGRSWWTPLITDFLLQLDSSLNDRTGVVVVGATNRYQDLEPALIRPGRLAKRIRVEPPTTEALEGILRHYLDQDLRDVDLRPLALLTTGATGAAAAGWVNGARRSARNAGRAITVDDLWDAAVGKETRTAEERWRIAVHEAGHCVVGYHIGRTADFVTLRAIGEASGHTRFNERLEATRNELEKAVVVILGGLAAERQLIGDSVLGSGGHHGSDLHLATEVIAQGHVSFGWGDNLVWRSEPEKAVQLLNVDTALLDTVRADVERHFETANTIIAEQADACRALAELLISRSSLDTEQLEEFFRAI